MAPTKEIKKKKETYLKEIILFKHCKKGFVPPSYIGIHSSARNFGFKFSELTIDETKLVIWGVRKGQQGATSFHQR